MVQLLVLAQFGIFSQITQSFEELWEHLMDCCLVVILRYRIHPCY